MINIDLYNNFKQAKTTLKVICNQKVEGSIPFAGTINSMT